MNTHLRRPGRRLLGAVAGLALITAACGSDDTSGSDTTEAPAADATTAPDATTPDAMTSDDGSAGSGDGIDQRVVSLSPTHTEMMLSLIHI